MCPLEVEQLLPPVDVAVFPIRRTKRTAVSSTAISKRPEATSAILLEVRWPRASICSAGAHLSNRRYVLTTGSLHPRVASTAKDIQPRLLCTPIVSYGRATSSLVGFQHRRQTLRVFVKGGRTPMLHALSAYTRKEHKYCEKKYPFRHCVDCSSSRIRSCASGAKPKRA